MRSLLGTLACFSVLACSDGLGIRSPTDLEEAERKWERGGPASYVYVVRVLCFCPVDLTAPVRVRVEDGEVVERTYADSGMPVPPAFANPFSAVEGLFVMLRRAYAEGADDVTVAYDADVGYPTQLSIDYDRRMADEEIGVTVTEGPVPIPVP